MTRAMYFYELVFTYGNQTLRYETYNQNFAYCIIGIRYLPGQMGLKSVFCKDNSVEYGFDRCVQF